MQSLCPNPNVCGSCGWSHIPYPNQLEQKLAEINGSFGLKELSIRCTEILPSPSTAHYRNRMDFVIDFEGRVGLREKGKWWRVIDNHTCFISDKLIEANFRLVRDWVRESGLTYFDRKKHIGFLRYAVIRVSTLKQVMINIVTSEPEAANKQQAELALLNLAERAKDASILWSVNKTVQDVSFGETPSLISGLGYLEEELHNTKYRISPNAFFQTNSLGAELLLKTVDQYVEFCNPSSILDLYCGGGFFSVSLAKKQRKVVGVELVEEAIKDARINAEINQVAVDFHVAKAEKFDWKQQGFELVVLDPPRCGLHDDALKDLVSAKPRSIVYVSCNYKAFAREFVFLKDYYDLNQIRAIDMFPHTPHVELLTLLTRK